MGSRAHINLFDSGWFSNESKLGFVGSEQFDSILFCRFLVIPNLYFKILIFYLLSYIFIVQNNSLGNNITLLHNNNNITLTC